MSSKTYKQLMRNTTEQMRQNNPMSDLNIFGFVRVVGLGFSTVAGRLLVVMATGGC